MNKKVNKGGQTTIMSDSGRFRPRAYIHRHKLNLPIAGMTRRGTIELCHLMSEIGNMILPQDPTDPTANGLASLLFSPSGQPTTPDTTTSPPVQRKKGMKKIFRKKPVVCADNFFFDDKMCEWIGLNGFGSIGTNARNALLKEIEKSTYMGKNMRAGPNTRRWLDLRTRLSR